MIGMNMAPGLHRHFAFEEWNWVDSDLISHVRARALGQIKQDIQLDILGTDIDARMVEIAKRNAEEAGVSEQIVFKQMRQSSLWREVAG